MQTIPSKKELSYLHILIHGLLILMALLIQKYIAAFQCDYQIIQSSYQIYHQQFDKPPNHLYN